MARQKFGDLELATNKGSFQFKILGTSWTRPDSGKHGDRPSSHSSVADARRMALQLLQWAQDKEDAQGQVAVVGTRP